MAQSTPAPTAPPVARARAGRRRHTATATKRGEFRGAAPVTPPKGICPLESHIRGCSPPRSRRKHPRPVRVRNASAKDKKTHAHIRDFALCGGQGARSSLTVGCMHTTTGAKPLGSRERRPWGPPNGKETPRVDAWGSLGATRLAVSVRIEMSTGRDPGNQRPEHLKTWGTRGARAGLTASPSRPCVPGCPPRARAGLRRRRPAPWSCAPARA